VKNRSYEALEMGAGKSSLRHTFNSHRPCGDCITRRRTPAPLCGAFRMEKTAYRYAGVTLAMIVLIPRSNVAWIVALHRFFEVSIGILVALAVVAVWPEHQPESGKQNAE